MTTDNPNKLRVQCAPMDADTIYPECSHGPTLFFYKDNDLKNGYFACSAYRDKRDCGFKMPLNKLQEKALQKKWEAPTQIAENRKMRQKALKLGKGKTTFYCHTCNVVLLSKETKSHDQQHEIIKLTNNHLQDPTQLLKPAQNDKIQAQYFFDEKSLKFFAKCFVELEINKVLCMGAPRLHAHLQKEQHLNIKSFLLDFDSRFYYFYDDTQFAWYNMCNHHFFDEQQKNEFLSFLKSSNNERLLIFTDPPFGCRTEAIAQTLRNLTYLYNNINELPHQPLPIFWIFPYFMGQYVKEDMPELQMSDYKINYTNHVAYADNGGKENRKLGSPVRLFTNVPIHMLKLPVDEGYKYCAKCQCYTALENRHCKLCETCPSKNGSTYRHCQFCGLCVKPNYVHCKNCRRCTQIDGHNCSVYQTKQRCWICQQIGHIERHCMVWKNASKKYVLTAVEAENEPQIHCLLCDLFGHNELKCPIREHFVEETTFLGKTTTRIK